MCVCVSVCVDVRANDRMPQSRGRQQEQEERRLANLASAVEKFATRKKKAANMALAWLVSFGERGLSPSVSCG